MNAVVIEHVPVHELPEPWRARLALGGSATVTVRIEEEAMQPPRDRTEERADDPLFGMWRDRDDLADVAGHVRRLRASRFEHDSGQQDGG